MFSTKKHVLNQNISIAGKKYISCDYGTQNPMVFLMWAKFNKKWICIKEYYYSGRDQRKQKTDSEYADDLVEFIGDEEIEQIIIDPSAASFITEVKKRGYNVKKANNDVDNGIRLVGNMLNLEKLMFSSMCRMTIKEFGSYVWNQKSAMKGEDVPVKENDHCMDAVRYFVYTMLKKTYLNRDVRGGI